MDDLLLTAGRMRGLEAVAMASGTVTGAVLMERAGLGAVNAILAEWPELATMPGRAIVLCGPGNNGGDGFVVARLLAQRGWDVEAYLLGDAARLPMDAAANHARWAETGSVGPLTDGTLDRVTGEGEPAPALVIDAVFGTGLTRPLGLPSLARSLRRIATTSSGGAVVALDVPSGWCADSGRWLGEDAAEGGSSADLTVAFHALKPCHVLGEGSAACGRVRRVGIGIAAPVDGVPLCQPSLDLIQKGAGHKYDHGHALILTGGLGRTGAARLAARAALRIGAGLVTCAAPGSAMMECATQLTAVMLRRCDDGAALAILLEDDRINALCLGPGMGISARTDALLDVALGAGRGIVLDADALSVLARRKDPFGRLHEGCILTPHGGEFARLFPDIAARMTGPVDRGPAFSRIDATREAAARAGCTVLLKGPDTVIAGADGTVRVNAAVRDRAAPWLATAGAGDVLAGLVAGLSARGLSPLEAASAAAWLHVEAARAFGPGLIAEDLPDAVPRVLAGSAP